MHLHTYQIQVDLTNNTWRVFGVYDPTDETGDPYDALHIDVAEAMALVETFDLADDLDAIDEQAAAEPLNDWDIPH